MRRGRPLESTALLLSLAWLAAAGIATGAPQTRGTAQILSDLEGDTAHKAAISGPLDKARQALARAHSMDQAGDSRHAAQLRATAREWLGVAEDVVRAADAEVKAEKAEKDLDDLETKRARGRALLEETIARRGRAQGLLEQIEHETAEANAASAAKKPAAKGGQAQPAVPAAPRNKPTSHSPGVVE